MNKHLIVIGIVLLLLVVGLSGCNESSNYGDEDLVEIYNVTVKTKWNEGYLTDVKNFEEDGFYHGVSADDENVWNLIYLISGTVKNIAGKKLNYIKVSAKLYDSDGNYLSSSNDALETIIRNLPNTYTKNFCIEIRAPFLAGVGTFEYFYSVEDYELEVIVS